MINPCAWPLAVVSFQSMKLVFSLNEAFDTAWCITCPRCRGFDVLLASCLLELAQQQYLAVWLTCFCTCKVVFVEHRFGGRCGACNSFQQWLAARLCAALCFVCLVGVVRKLVRVLTSMYTISWCHAHRCHLLSPTVYRQSPCNSFATAPCFDSRQSQLAVGFQVA